MLNGKKTINTGIMREYKSPSTFKINTDRVAIFLGGDVTTDWRTEIIELYGNNNVDILNPVRKNGLNLQTESANNDIFYRQVNWELKYLNLADIVIINIAPYLDNDIGLLHLGLSTKFSDKVVVICPDDYSKRGYVELLCEYYNISLVNDINGLK